MAFFLDQRLLIPLVVLIVISGGCNRTWWIIWSVRSWCPSTAQSRFHIRLPLTPSSYPSPFLIEIFDIKAISIGAIVRINIVLGFGGHASFGFPPKTIGIATPPGTLYLGGKFGEDRWRIAIYIERSTRFVWQTALNDSYTDTVFIICSMLLIQWADKN